MSVELPMKMNAIRQQLGVSNSYFSALTNRMGMRYRRIGFLSEFTQFLRDNPGFKFSDVYHGPECECPECLQKRVRQAAAGKPRGRPAARVEVGIN